MTQKTYSKSDIKKFLEEWPQASSFMHKKSQVFEKDTILFVEKKPLFFKKDERWIPTLHLLLERIDFLPRVIVDKGAIRFVVNGADVMRPGIVQADAFAKGAIVVIVDETVGKPIAVGQSLYDSKELLAQKEGKSILSLHYVSDIIWNA